MARINCAFGIGIYATSTLRESILIQAGIFSTLLCGRRFDVRSVCCLRVAFEPNYSLSDFGFSAILLGNENDILGIRMLTAGELPVRNGIDYAACKSFVNSLLGLDNLAIR